MFDVKVDEGIFLGYSLTSKAYRVLNKRSKKIKETYYMSFDHIYMKKLTSSKETMDEIFPQTGQVSIHICNLFEEYVKLFDEPKTSILSEAKATDNDVDNLKKVIDEAAKII